MGNDEPLKTRYVGVDAAAEYLGTTPKAIYNLVARREIPFIKRGRSVKFDVKRLDTWMRKYAIEPALADEKP